MTHKAIIFDLGGVLINLDFHLTKQAFIDLGLPPFETLYSAAQQETLFNNYEMGRISSADFIAALQKLITTDVEEMQLIKAWNAMLLDFPIERLQLLKELSKNYQLFLLSNTNAIHLDAISTYLKQTYAISLDNYFHKAYYSFKVGIRKPDKEIFKLVLEENKLQPTETLFIDDTMQHINSAKQLGIDTIWLQPTNTILDILQFQPKK